ncbi:hypothetical protein JCM11641_002684 [Rhodosporidiobolus odoratus]
MDKLPVELLHCVAELLVDFDIFGAQVVDTESLVALCRISHRSYDAFLPLLYRNLDFTGEQLTLPSGQAPPSLSMPDLRGIVDTGGDFTEGPVTGFLLEALKFLDPSVYAKATFIDSDDWDQLQAAYQDYSAFLSLFPTSKEGSDPPHDTLPAYILRVSPFGTSPFSSLRSLILQRNDCCHEEFFLVFYTPLLANLKDLELFDREGYVFDFKEADIQTLRRSITHDPPGVIDSPHTDDATFDPQAAWAPLSPQEWQTTRSRVIAARCWTSLS